MPGLQEGILVSGGLAIAGASNRSPIWRGSQLAGVRTRRLEIARTPEEDEHASDRASVTEKARAIFFATVARPAGSELIDTTSG